MNLTFQFIINVHNRTGVNILGLVGEDWLKTSPKVQIMVINEYRLQHKKPLIKEGKIPKDFLNELTEAVDFFLSPSEGEILTEQKQKSI